MLPLITELPKNCFKDVLSVFFAVCSPQSQSGHHILHRSYHCGYFMQEYTMSIKMPIHIIVSSATPKKTTRHWLNSERSFRLLRFTAAFLVILSASFLSVFPAMCHKILYLSLSALFHKNLNNLPNHGKI